MYVSSEREACDPAAGPRYNAAMEDVTLAAAVYSGVQLAKPVVDSAVAMMEKLLGRPIKIASNLLSDEVYCWQTANRIRWANKVDAMLKGRNVPPKILPKGFLLPVIEAVGNVEDETLCDMWARLTANAVANDDAQHPMFIDALKQLNGKDAIAFDSLVKAGGVRSGFRADGRPDDSSKELDLRLTRCGLLDRIYEADASNLSRAMSSVSARLAGSNRVDPIRIQIDAARPARVRSTGTRVSGFGYQFHAAVSDRAADEKPG
jgi:hypothetical protein